MIMEMKKIFKIIFSGFGIIIFYSSCQIATKSNPYVSAEPTNKTAVYAQTSREVIDYTSIQRLLKLDKSVTQLGYDERVFNTCKVGFGYSGTENCSGKFFVVIHFKLMCRNSEGTVSSQLQEEELIPVANQNLRWTIKNTSGELRTDSEGHGQVMLVAARSQRAERFRVSSSKDFLLMRAGDIKRLVVPSNWCE